MLKTVVTDYPNFQYEAPLASNTSNYPPYPTVGILNPHIDLAMKPKREVYAGEIKSVTRHHAVDAIGRLETYPQGTLWTAYDEEGTRIFQAVEEKLSPAQRDWLSYLRQTNIPDNYTALDLRKRLEVVGLTTIGTVHNKALHTTISQLNLHITTSNSGDLWEARSTKLLLIWSVPDIELTAQQRLTLRKFQSDIEQGRLMTPFILMEGLLALQDHDVSLSGTLCPECGLDSELCLCVSEGQDNPTDEEKIDILVQQSSQQTLAQLFQQGRARGLIQPAHNYTNQQQLPRLKVGLG